MPTIRMITDWKDMHQVAELCHQQDEPIFVERNGANLVVMSMEAYEKQLGILGIYRKLADAEKQLENETALEQEEVFRRLREKREREV